MGVTDDLQRVVKSIWRPIVDRPLVVELGEGTLDGAPFHSWVTEDYDHVIEYAEVVAHGATKAPDPNRMGTFPELIRWLRRESYSKGGVTSPRRRRADRLLWRTVTSEASFFSAADYPDRPGPGGGQRW